MKTIQILFLCLFIIHFFLVSEYLSAQDDAVNPIYQKMQRGDLDTAEMIAKDLIEKEPNNPHAYHTLGRVHHAQKKYRESISALEKSLTFQNQPTWMIGWSYTFSGFNYRDLGEKEKAVEYLQKAVKLNATRNCVNAAGNALKQMGVEPDPSLEKYRLSLEGQPAPNFDLTDVYGQTHRLVDYKGIPLFVHIGATWCGGCQQEAEWVEQLAETFLPQGVVFITLCPGENEAAVMDYLKHYRSQCVGGVRVPAW
ncbi:MAG: hypothetical protein C4527_10330 [Candidatus Omnitrophota bacterium]|jgi:tetratricopeptide (TPR) repeat protein|nr:MAG: hypothetical protein C4527_10330 [Candidatus Omnitrophota bacterium]